MDVMKGLGIERVVVVQPLAYGTDNRCTLDAMQEFGQNARGIAVIDENFSDKELSLLFEAGIRGIRFCKIPGGILSWDSLPTLASRIHSFGRHIQLQMDGRGLPEKESILRRLPCDLVVDHLGKYLGPVDIDHPAFKVLLRLVDTGRCWVKLSAPYESSSIEGPPHYCDLGRLAKELVSIAPERMLWGTNWPHPTKKENKPDENDLLDLFLDWVEDETTRHLILVANPAELFDF
jgi:D-galactarolactone isomerase